MTCTKLSEMTTRMRPCTGFRIHPTYLPASALLWLVFATACGGEDAAAPGDVDIGPNGGVFGAETEGGSCVPLDQSLPTDYTPGKSDGWPACVSDDGKFHPFESSISTAARAKAFDDIAKLLFTPASDPSPDAFIEARLIYDEDEGIGSRVVRRYDPHNEVPRGTNCTKAADVKAEPTYCAGPGRILPIAQDALAEGAKGNAPRFQAGRLEGALLWFFAISTYKETFSCSDTIADCDSAYAYYDGAGAGYALGGYVAAVDPDADDAAKLGALAVNCWRDVDMTIPPKNTALRERARAQFDRAVIRGALSVLLDRIDQAKSATGDTQRFHWGFIRTFLGALDSQVWRDGGAKKAIAAAQLADAPTDLDSLAAALKGLANCGR